MMRLLLPAAALAFGLAFFGANVAEAANCFGAQVLSRYIGANQIDTDRFFTLCPGQAIISIDGVRASDQLGMYVERADNGALVCNRQFARDSHTCAFNVSSRGRYYVRVINYGSQGANYRFISN